MTQSKTQRALSRKGDLLPALLRDLGRAMLLLAIAMSFPALVWALGVAIGG